MQSGLFGFMGLASSALCFLPSGPHSWTLCRGLQSCQLRPGLEGAAAQIPRSAGCQAERLYSEELSEDHCGKLRNVQIQMGSPSGTLSSWHHDVSRWHEKDLWGPAFFPGERI